jgi:ubiquinol-cytochrome c reductase cytochrome c subunit
MSSHYTPPSGGVTRRRRRSRGGSKTMRRITGGLALLFGLTAMGFLYASIAPQPETATASNIDAAQVAEGKQIYQTACITCHGANLQGVTGRGPSLVGVGQAATYFRSDAGRGERGPDAAPGAVLRR